MNIILKVNTLCNIAHTLFFLYSIYKSSSLLSNIFSLYLDLFLQMSNTALIIEKTSTYDVQHERTIISNFGTFLGKIWFEKNDDVMVIEICTKLQQS